MKRSNKWIIIAGLFISSLSNAQDNKSDPARHEEKVRDLIEFFEYALNTIGRASTSTRDKDVLITESYAKIFRDANVQIEDDLASTRSTITNKDVQAYLKDVDYFFRDVQFDFTIEAIKGQTTVNNQLFYKVSLTRNLKGTTIDGVEINNTIPRFIEINLDPETQDLRIVSVYTNEFDEREALQTWWSSLSYEWQAIFKRQLNITDSVRLDDLKNMTAIETLDISNNPYVVTLEPLSTLHTLRTLNVSGTGIETLTPIRNLSNLTSLNFSGTKVSDMEPLKYAGRLQVIDLSHTQVTDISVLERMPQLTDVLMQAAPVTSFTPLASLHHLNRLNVEATQLQSLEPLAGLSELTELIASGTPISDLTPLSGLLNLELLKLDSTGVTDLGPLRNLNKLNLLHINSTPVTNLESLADLTALQRVYCDRTRITRNVADAFMRAKPGVLVIVDSEDLRSWWSTLPYSWQQQFINTGLVQPSPSKEELARLTTLDSINLSGNKLILDIEPLERLTKLKYAILAGTAIRDLSPLRDHTDIQYLDISGTAISDISLIRRFNKLTHLIADDTNIQQIETLVQLSDLVFLSADKTGVNDFLVQEFLDQKKNCLVIYKTARLKSWWTSLSPEWKQVMNAQIPLQGDPDSKQLHRLIELNAIYFEDISITDLSPLQMFVNLKSVSFSNTRISDLNPLAEIGTLRSLSATHSPVTNLAALAELQQLESLDISNTPVTDLKTVGLLSRLKSLNCSGTPIRRLNEISGLSLLEFLDCSNTDVRKLDPVIALPLKTLRCYNTGITSRRVADFQAIKPDCQVVHY